MDEHKDIEASATGAEPTAAAGDAPPLASSAAALSASEGEVAQIQSPPLAPAAADVAGIEPPQAQPQKPAPAFDEIKPAASRTGPSAGILLVPAIEAERASARSRKFAVLAACVTAVLALGAVAGAVSMSGTAPVAAPPVATHSADSKAPADTASLHSEIAKLRAEVSTLKASLETANRASSAQIAKLSDRIDHTQAELAVRATKTTDQLEHRADATASLAKDVTGSIAPAPGAPAAPAALPPAAPQQPPVVPGWVLRDVYHGAAILQGRFGAMIELAPGDAFPGIGRVESIRRQDGRWIVLTSRGMITSMR